MNVSGIAILSRKAIVTRRFGGEAWGQLFRDVAGSHRCFRSLITADTLISLPAFLAFHDELMRRFFRDDEAAHVALGREACRWALAGGSIEFKVFDLPQWHPYFEHFVVGYIAEVLETFCANPIRTVRLRGGAGKAYHYLFHGSPSVPHAELETRRPRLLPGIEAQRHLSHRELEVLLQVANGKTNEEIGVTQGISGKTAQHHVASAYRKIGVAGRVGAAIWLAERGLVGS